VQQRGQQPDGHGLAAEHHRLAPTAQRNQRRDQATSHEPAQHEAGFGKLPIPRLAREEPEMEGDERGAQQGARTAEHVP